MNIIQYREMLRGLMTDRCSINRRKTVINMDKTTSIVMPKEPLYTEVECRLSISSGGFDKANDIEVDRNPIMSNMKLFFPFNADIIAGDFIIVKRKSFNGDVIGTYQGNIGMPMCYDTHKEAFLFVDRSA